MLLTTQMCLYRQSEAFFNAVAPQKQARSARQAFSFAECLNFSPLRGENKAGRLRLPAQAARCAPRPRSRTEAVISDDLDDRSGVDETVAGLVGIVVVDSSARGIPARKRVTRG